MSDKAPEVATSDDVGYAAGLVHDFSPSRGRLVELWARMSAIEQDAELKEDVRWLDQHLREFPHHNEAERISKRLIDALLSLIPSLSTPETQTNG